MQSFTEVTCSFCSKSILRLTATHNLCIKRHSRVFLIAMKIPKPMVLFQILESDPTRLIKFINTRICDQLLRKIYFLIVTYTIQYQVFMKIT